MSTRSPNRIDCYCLVNELDWIVCMLSSFLHKDATLSSMSPLDSALLPLKIDMWW